MSLVNTLGHHRTFEAVATDGVAIAYEDIGRGEPLVLLHGVTENSECWHEAGYVARLLRRGHRLILIDCRGHGRSGKPHDPAAYSGRRRAADVLAVLDRAGVRHAALMGHSMGGVVALAAALYHPDRVSSVVVNGAHPFAEDLTPFRAALDNDFEAWLGLLTQLAPGLSHAARRRIGANDLIAIRASLAEDRPDFAAAFAALDTPLLAISGTLDPRCGPIHDFAQLSGGRFLPLADKNHITAFLDVDTVVPAVDAFLDSVGTRNKGQGG